MNNTFDAWEGEHLAHYGILGMKWGQRRFQNKDGSLTPRGEKHYAKTGERGYQYKSHATKKYSRKAAKAEAKGKTEKAAIYKNRAKRSAELDRREQEAAKKTSTGKAIATRMLFGGDKSKAYQQYQAMYGGKNPGKATKAFSAVQANYGGTMGSRLAKAAYIRRGEKDHGFMKRYDDNMQKAYNQVQSAEQKARKARKKLGV